MIQDLLIYVKRNGGIIFKGRCCGGIQQDKEYVQTLKYIRAIEEYGGISRDDEKKKDSLPRLNGLAQDGLAMLTRAQFNLDLLAPQLPSDDHAHASLLEKSYSKRELLLGGGEESTVRRRNLHICRLNMLFKTSQK